MLAAMILAAAAGGALGVWPEDVGAPAAVVHDIEVYTVDPEDDYWIIAIQPLAPAIGADDPAAVAGVVRTALKLGADAVLLLGELPEAAIPDDVDVPLEPTGRYAVVVFVGFYDTAEEEAEEAPSLQAGWQGPGVDVDGDDHDEGEEHGDGRWHATLPTRRAVG